MSISNSGKRKYAAFVAVVMACSAVLVAKSKDPEKDKKSEVKFTSRAELVLIPTLVSDKSGKHITGLKNEDFKVLENGVEQKVTVFEEVASEIQRLSRPLNPNEFSNAVASGASNRRITLIVLDFINTPITDQAYARQDLLKYLTQSLTQREPTALYTLNRTGVHVIHDFTTDPRVLVAALHKIRGDTSRIVDNEQDMEAANGTASPDGSSGVDPAAVQSETEKLQTMMEDAELTFQSFQQRLAITYTLQAMQQVAQALAGFPGRKSLIWAGGGFPFSVSDNTMQLAPAGRDSLSDVLPMYERTWQLLNDAQIALYPIDVKGLQTLVANASVRNPGRNYARNTSWRQMDTQDTLRTFAAMTGGRAYYNSNDLVKGFRDAVNDSAQYYMLGYYLDRSQTKPGWRKLSVKVDRDHTEVRARSGFFVINSTTDPQSSRASDISLALHSPLDYTSLSLVAQWDKTEPSRQPGKKRVIYSMHVAADSTLIDDADDNHLKLDFIALAKTSEGKPAEPPSSQTVDGHLKAGNAAKVRETGISYRGSLELAPGTYTVRFIVRDTLSGRLGSVAAPLVVQ